MIGSHGRFVLPALIMMIVMTGVAKQALAEDSSHLQAPPPQRVILGDTLSSVQQDGHEQLSPFVLTGEAAKTATLKVVPVKDETFDQAYQVTTPGPSKHPWSMQLTHKIPAKLTKGEVLLVSFAARVVNSADTSDSQQEAQPGVVQFLFEAVCAPYGKSINRMLPVGAQWRYYNLSFHVRGNYAAGETHAAFDLGNEGQTIQIADVRIVSYGIKGKLESLPVTPVTYDGRAADAPWRAAAAKRIDRYRKADLTVTVIDALGRPVPSAAVHAAMTRHAFSFGTAVNLNAFFAKGRNAEIYRRKIAKLFNFVVFESAFKWNHYGKGPNRTPEKIQEALDWFDAHHIPVRGHNLVWPDWRHMTGLKALADQPDALRAKVARHVREMTTRWRGQVVGWDVVNEPYQNHDLMDILGQDVVGDWFRIARAGAPEAALFLNEHSILTKPGWTPHDQAYFDLARRLKANHAPIGGIGMESHFSSWLTSPTQVYRKLDRYAKLGLPIKITEFDVSFQKPNVRADYTRDFYTIAFSHPDVKAILMWGFWAGKHWRPDAAMFARDWTPRPNFHAWHDLVFKKWWTDQTLKTDPSGIVKIRGFRGHYRITASVDGRESAVNATLGGDGAHVTVVLGKDADSKTP